MKNILNVFVMLNLVSLSAFARVNASEVANTLVDLRVQKVERYGEVLKTDRIFPRGQSYLVGIPVTVDPSDACTALAGQETINNTILKVKGSRNPVYDACIAVMPEPIQTMLTIKLENRRPLLNRRGLLQTMVQIDARQYYVTLDTANDHVTVQPFVGRPVPQPRPIPFR